MPNQKNIETLKIVNEKFARAKGIYFTNYKGLSVQQMNDLRRELYNSRVEFQVVKKTITKLAAKNIGLELTDDIMQGQIGLAYSYDDPTLAGKLLANFIKKNKLEQVTITGCIFEGAIFDGKQVNAVINLPPKNEQLAMLLGALQAPMSNLVGVLKATMGQLVGTLQGLKETKNQ